MRLKPSKLQCLALFLGFWFLAACGEEPVEEERRDEPLECSVDGNLSLFQQRIEPLIGPERKPSCSRCHLPGTDFQEYVFEGDACRTMACLEDSGLVDFETPEESKMLGWILRGSEEAESSLIDDDVVRTEYEAFKQWIEFSAQCGVEFCGDIPNPCGFENVAPEPDPDMSEYEPPPLTREGYGCDARGLTQAFHDHIHDPWRGRCAHCHVEDAPTNTPGPVWLTKDTTVAGAGETLSIILERDYFDFESPEQSLWLLKPISEDDGGVEHGGGTKALKDDEMYTSTIQWIQLRNECLAP